MRVGRNEGRTASEGGPGIVEFALEPSCSDGLANPRFHSPFLPLGGLLLPTPHVHSALRGGACKHREVQGGGRTDAARESSRRRPWGQHMGAHG